MVLPDARCPRRPHHRSHGAAPGEPRSAVFSHGSRLHGRQPCPAYPADSIAAHQAAKALASFLHVSEQFSERSRIFYSQKPPTPPPLHTLMHAFSHAANARPASTGSEWRLNPQNVSESWLGKSRGGGVTRSHRPVTEPSAHTQQ